ncbi:ABC transporter ATP-binding protein [Dictyobacter formicarum]|uniref:HlyB/MsbA family ABC transporter n=1 Tax=Dictyobacter formicarum TaxID=2778368 RepID=A0ABQ3VI68_9CHLR|nr:ABC transporter ATP-binding protein [Dictyobacter formicarum]GHO85750.1 HlyB/MsbA family ABC transporter [Dictyobacter formicarum]
MKTYTFLARLIRASRGSYLLAILLQFPRRLLLLAPGLIIQQIIDGLTHGMQLDLHFWTLIGLFFGLMLTRMAALMLVQISERFPIFTIERLLRKNLLEHLLRLPGVGRLPYAAGDIVNRLQEEPASLGHFLVMGAFVAGMMVETVVALTIMARINLQLTVIAVLPLLLGNVVVNAFGGRIEHYRRLNRAAASDVSSYLLEMLGTVQAIQVAGSTASVVNHFRSLNQRRRQASLRENILSNTVLGIFGSGISNVGIGLILLLAGSALQSGHFTIGDFTLFVAYMRNLTRFSSEVIGMIAGYRRAGVAQQRLTELMIGGTPEQLLQPGPLYQRGPLPEVPPIVRRSEDRLEQLEIRNLSYYYPGTTHGISGINLTIRRGQIVVITGRIGSGKTTLLRALLGLLPGQEGEIYWNGQLVADPTSFFVPPRSAYTPQSPGLFSASLRENITLGLPLDDEEVRAALHRAVMEHDVEKLPQGWDTLVGPRGLKLSGGQVQRTAAARMFARQAELLVIDDLSSALDIETERLLWQRLFSDRSTTCLIVSHRQHVLRQADHLLVLKDGQIETQYNPTTDALPPPPP